MVASRHGPKHSEKAGKFDHLVYFEYQQIAQLLLPVNPSDLMARDWMSYLPPGKSSSENSL